MLNLFKLGFLSSLFVGLAIGSKFTGIIFLTSPILAVVLRNFRHFKNRKERFLEFSRNLAIVLLIGSLTICFSVLSSPFNLLDYQGFLGSVFGYEKDVALGTYPAFYTRQFINTTPILFQIEKVFPYALGWPIFILGSMGFLLMIISLISKLVFSMIKSIMYQVLSIKRKKHSISQPTTHNASRNSGIHDAVDAHSLQTASGQLTTYFFLLTTSFLVYFLPNAVLYTKWTRFMTPILPFFSVFATFAIFSVYSSLKVLRSKFQISNFKFQINLQKLKYTNLFVICYLLFVIFSILPGLAFFSIYTREDSRVMASKWIYDNLPDNSYVLSETANVIDIPLGIPSMPSMNYQVISFDFYHLDEDYKIYQDLKTKLFRADYIFIPSRRIFTNHTRNPEKFPKVAKYYQLLFSGKLGFEKVAEIASYPSLGPLQFPDEQAEETWTVFDHPVIRIYKKVTPKTYEEYSNLLI